MEQGGANEENPPIQICIPSAESSKVPGLSSAYRKEWDVLRSYIREREPDMPVMLLNLTKVKEQWQRWKHELPRVEVFYATKCNSDLGLMRFLSKLGANFDCASLAEMQLIIEHLNLPAESIVYSNVFKEEYGMHYAHAHGVRLTTFDSISELTRISQHMPNAELMLRIIPSPLSVSSQKFGAHPKEWAQLLDFAKTLRLKMVGVNFHVGWGTGVTSMFIEAIRSARRVFDMGVDRGFEMRILDIGGGFPNAALDVEHRGPIFEDITKEMRNALDELFPPTSNFRIIAEPGQFFSGPAICLAVKVNTR